MVIGILHNESKKECTDYVNLLRERIITLSEKLTGEKWEVLDLIHCSADTVAAKSEILLSVGGDGTFLKTASVGISHGVPVCGFNLGTLGLLTEFEPDDPSSSIEKIIRGQYILEDRRILHVQVIGSDGTVKFDEMALNDCVLERGTLSGLAYIKVSIGGNFVDTYPCNGIVVATQTGSTAYSMSAGGPIVEPGNDVTVVTPVCAHFTDGRPIIAKAISTVTLHMGRPHECMFVSADGHKNIRFENDDTVICRPAENMLKIVRIDPPNFYEALRNKSQERRRKINDET